MTTWFTSDTHYYHKNIIQYCNRQIPLDESGELGPLSKFTGGLIDAVQAMNQIMVKRWNEKVQPDDEVWHLGDFAFCGKNAAIEILEQLNGKKRLILGNHDYSLIKKIDVFFDEIYDYKMLKVHMNYQADDGEIVQYHQPVVLCHFPILSWDLMRHGSWHLHGHCHGTLPETAALRMDVGVDTNNYYPWSVEDIQDKLALRTVMPESSFDSDPLHARR